MFNSAGEVHTNMAVKIILPGVGVWTLSAMTAAIYMLCLNVSVSVILPCVGFLTDMARVEGHPENNKI